MVLNSRKLLAAVVLAMLAAVVLALPTSAAPAARSALEANLTGKQEVPGPGDPNGRGNAMVKVYEARVCYTLEARRIKPAMAAHIHLGLRGEAGPIVATLKPPTDGSSKGCVAVPRALSLGLKENPAHYYVNVHNKPYPEGAIRGQLHATPLGQ
jgi:hypothetical protein